MEEKNNAHVDVVLPAFKNLLENSDQPDVEKVNFGYGDIYFHLDFSRTEPSLAEILFNGVVKNTIERLYASNETGTPDSVKLKDERGQILFDMEFFKRGGYGKLYISKDNRNTVCKMLRSCEIGRIESENALITEAMIHSILSNDERQPIACSKFFGIKLETNTLYSPLIFSEKMNGPLNKIPTLSPRIFDLVVCQMASALEHLQDKYKFIHGDLKINNICYQKIGYKSYRFVMVDFGMSTLVYKGTEISTNVLIRRGGLVDMKFPNSGDLSLLMASLYEFFHGSRNVINDLLTFPGENEPLTTKYGITKTPRETYYLCYGCHNPKTLPQTIVENIKRKETTTT